MLEYQEFVAYVRQSVPRFNAQWLNSQQDDAVRAPAHPPTFIVAGPGSGKTTVLALRVLKLILVDGLLPSAIIATTFTRKAAAELRSRILAWGYNAIAGARASTTQDLVRLQWLNEIDINAVRVGTLDSLTESFLAECRPPGGITPATIEGFFASAIMRRFGLFAHQRFQNVDLTAFFTNLFQSGNSPIPFSAKLDFLLSLADRVRHDSCRGDVDDELSPVG